MLRVSLYMEKRKIVVGVFWVLFMGLFYFFFSDSLNIHTLNKHRQVLVTWAAANPTAASLYYVLGVSGVIALTVPGATTLSFAGGVLFRQPEAAIYAYLGFVLGACLSYMMVCTLLREWASTWLSKVRGYKSLENKLKENAFMYLIYARYTLVFPFWFVNGTAALVGVNFGTFALATALAVIPGSIIYTTAGRALSSLLDSLDDDAVRSLSTGQILKRTLVESRELKICLFLLAVTAAVPLVVKRLMAKRKSA
jgi:uncharacterized membrane protein YdjX (TVP38/TMEM64 family)